MRHPELRTVFLNPGDFHFGDEYTRIQTILGSCVSITLWHPILRIGGMCHFVLPTRTQDNVLQKRGTYATDVMEMFGEFVLQYETRFSEYQAKVFGGGNMFPDLQRDNSTLDVARKNIEVAEKILKELQLPTTARDVGGSGHRKLIFDVASGDVWLKRSDNPKLLQETIARMGA